MDVLSEIAKNLPQDPDTNSNEYFANLFFDETNFQNYSVLKLFVNPDNVDLVEAYAQHIDAHNKHTYKNMYYNSGFDLINPASEQVNTLNSAKLYDLQVKGEMVHCKLFLQNDTKHPVAGMSSCSPYFLYPRSSISKTPLMLANHTGIIDAGYRGFLKAAVRSFDAYTIEKGTRLFQVCHPTLCPVYVVMVSEDQLTSTERGEGGFGSTGGTA
jgi:dUTP pyrophosphatase